MTQTTVSPIQRLQSTLDAMPPVAAMQIRVADFSHGALRLEAPLEANVNDKGNAFGGSLASVMTLAGWGLTSLQLEQAGLDAEVYVADSTIRYRAPVYGQLQASAKANSQADWEEFMTTFTKRGRARIVLHAAIDGGAAEMQARFVAIARS